jgi:hypothetical protein
VIAVRLRYFEKRFKAVGELFPFHKPDHVKQNLK